MTKSSVQASQPSVSIIAAVAENGVIGADNRLPWHLPGDLKHFRALTLNHAVIMGRKNYESIGRPLPQRRNIIVTRNRGFQAPGCEVVHSLDEALAAAGGGEVFIIGGAEIYRLALPHADKIYLTRVHAGVEGDVYFPAYDAKEWEEIARERHEADDRHAHAYTFSQLRRRG